jgi:hypothetical protein
MQKVDYKPTFEELVQMVNHVAKVGFCSQFNSFCLIINYFFE